MSRNSNNHIKKALPEALSIISGVSGISYGEGMLSGDGVGTKSRQENNSSTWYILVKTKK
jgi:hypothetical protein